MPRHSPYRIELSDEERAVLRSLARSYTLPYWQVTRAQMVLLAADGLRNDEIAGRLNCRREVVSQWRKRFYEQRLAGLEDQLRRGRPPTFPPHVRAEVIAMACELPASSGVPLSRWSSSELAREAVSRGIAEQISGVTVWRWLTEDAIKPWQHRSWIFPRDPSFADYVVCADEKPSIQARRRIAATRPARRGEGMKVEHEYERLGALRYLAAWDVRRAKIFDRCAPKVGIQPFGALVEQFMSQAPYADHQRSRRHSPRSASTRRRPPTMNSRSKQSPAGGENVLAAVLANALYGAAIGCGMLAEGQMLEQPTNQAQRLSLARAHALKASGAEGPGFVGAMHWQAAHIAGALRALKDHEQAPLGQALAAVSWALVLLLQAMCLAEPAGSTAVEVTNALADARAELNAAEEHLRRLDEQTADLASELDGLIAAAHHAMRTHGNGHTS